VATHARSRSSHLTRHLFDRARSEIAGVTMVDEGLTEGTCGPTVYVTWPLRRGELGRMLRHKRLRLNPSTLCEQNAMTGEYTS
jgi:hypothetical protein